MGIIVKTLPPALFIQLGKLNKEGFRLYQKEGLVSRGKGLIQNRAAPGD